MTDGSVLIPPAPTPAGSAKAARGEAPWRIHPWLIDLRHVRLLATAVMACATATAVLAGAAHGASDTRSMIAIAFVWSAALLLASAARTTRIDIVWSERRSTSFVAATMVAASWSVGTTLVPASVVVAYASRRLLGVGRRRDDHAEMSVAGLCAIAATLTGSLTDGVLAPGLAGTATALVAATALDAGSMHHADLLAAARTALVRLAPGVLGVLVAAWAGVPIVMSLAACCVGAVLFERRHVRRVELRESLTVQLADLVDRRLPWRARHAQRAADLALAVAHDLGQSVQARREAWWTTRAMDVGLLGAHDGPQSRAGALEEHERLALQYHPVRSAEIAAALGVPPSVARGILHHHVRHDDPAGDDRSVAARIANVTDSWIAMRSPRPHRGALTAGEARRALHAEAGSVHDPNIVTVLSRLAENHPDRWTGDVRDRHASGAQSPRARFHMIAFDPAIDDSGYRFVVHERATHAVRRGETPVLYVAPAARFAELTWFDVAGAEIWASPATVVLTVEDATLLRTAQETATHVRVLTPDGHVRAAGPPPAASTFAWRTFSRATVASWIVLPVLAAAMLATAWFTAIETFVVPTASMRPTIDCGARIFVRPLASDEAVPKPGSIVVFDNRIGAPTSIDRAYAGPHGERWHTKRVIAGPGQTVRMRDGRIDVDGIPQAIPRNDDYPADMRWRLSEDEVFVVGDNSLASLDSRQHGPVPRSSLVGVVVAATAPLAWLGSGGETHRPRSVQTCATAG